MANQNNTTQFLTQEEEFELVYGDEFQNLIDLDEEVNQPVPIPSPPKTQPRPSTSHSIDLSLLGDTPFSQIEHAPELTQCNPVNRRLFGPNASTPFTAKRKDIPAVLNQLSTIGLNDNNRKRRLNDLFGDLQDIDELSEIDYEHLAKKPKNEEEIDMEMIERILCMRKMNQLSNPLEKKNSLDRLKSWHYRKMQNLSYKEPNWPFVIMRSNDQRIFVRFHSEDFEMDEINEIGVQNRREESILGDMKQQVWQEAQELAAKRLLTDTQPMVIEPAVLPVPNIHRVEENLWVEKYRPRRYIDLLSDESTNRSLLQWLKLWDKVVFGREPLSKIKPNNINNNNYKMNTFNKKAGTFQPGGWNRNNKTTLNKEFDDIGRPVQKVALLCGPPGLGKTTLAHILAVHAGYAVREMNASDDRNVDAFRQTLENGTQMQSVLNADKRPNCIILDEIDGAPQASIDFLIRFVQDNAGSNKAKKKDGKKGFVLKRPIICICNDMYVSALRQLRQIAFVVNFPQITSEKLAERLLYISRSEHIKTDMTALLSLSEKTGNDVRSCISMLQFYGGLKKPLLLIDVLKSNIGQKDRHRGLFNVWNSIFQIQRPKSVLQKESDTVTLSDMSETTRMETVTQAVHSGGDYERLIQGVFENYLRQKVSDATMLRTSEALAWFCFNDRIQHIIAQQQNYSVYPYLQYGFVAWHFLFASLAWPKVTFPTKSYEAFQKATTVKMILTSIKKGIHPACTGLGADNETLLNSIPLIKRILCPQLRSVSVQLLSPKEKTDLKHAIGVMCDLGVCYNQIKAADGTYQFVLEPDLELISNFTGINNPQLNYWTKQLIARESDIEKVRRAAPTFTDKNTKKKPVEVHKEKPVKNVMNAPASALPNHLQRLQAKSIKSKKETVVKDFFGRIVTLPPITLTQELQEKSNSIIKSPIWYHYKEGFNNAVRKDLTIADLI